MNDFGTIDAIYQEFFREHKPARTSVKVSRIPRDALIAVEAIAPTDQAYQASIRSRIILVITISEICTVATQFGPLSPSTISSRFYCQLEP